MALHEIHTFTVPVNVTVAGNTGLVLPFFDANDPTQLGVPSLNPGDTATWVYEVSNPGGVSFLRANVQVTDNQPASYAIPPAAPTP